MAGNFNSTPPTNPSHSTERLRGVVERITYHNEENGYTVAKLSPEGSTRFGAGPAGEIAIVGNMAGINVGEFVELQGNWTVHPNYGRQFSVEQMRSVLPATIAGIEKYLGSGLIKGVGPVTAKRIVRAFGAETLNVIEEMPERLAEVAGVGSKRIRMIQTAWAEQRAIKEVMIFLQSHGVSTSLATRIYKTYGDAAVTLVRSDPYRLARDIYGIGFLTADRIAQSLGLALDSPQRIAAGVAYALNQAAEDGHVFLPTQELIAQAAELLGIAPEQSATGIVQLWDTQQVKVTPGPGGKELSGKELGGKELPAAIPATWEETPSLVAEQGGLYAASTISRAKALLAAKDAEEKAVYLTPFYYSEQGVAGRIHRLLQEGIPTLDTFSRPGMDWARAFLQVEQQDGLHLAVQQQEAVKATLTHRFVVLTGGPGTGKTTTVRTILHLCRQAGFQVLLAAPTGRAAKRLAEATGHPAKTLHRLLEFKPAEGMAFQRNEESPLTGDLLIVDEASMLDLVLAHHMLKAVPPGMHLLLVGDVDQLPSVGAGNVLQDIIRAIESRAASLPPQAGEGRGGVALASQARVIRLQTIFRQAAGSYIIANAHRINQGHLPIIANKEAQDFFLFRVAEPEQAARLCVELVQQRIPKRFAIPSADIQVLTPMHRGVAGVAALNEALQAAVNPPGDRKPERRLGSRVYRVGDRVMQQRNNYDKDVYNGDMGVITAVDLEMQQLTVMMDGRLVGYDFLELDELVHAYTISVHKSQGSEFPAVVIPLLTSHYMMLQRNLLYTAVSRARRLVVLVGQEKAIRIAVGNNRVLRRHTGLTERLLGEG